MIRKSVAILAVLGLCACGPELETEGGEGAATSQAGLQAAGAATTFNAAGEVPDTAAAARAPAPVLPPPPTLPLDPIPLTVVRPVAPPVQLVAPALVVPAAQ